MKKTLLKMIPAIGVVLFSAGLLSCTNDSNEELALDTVSVPVNISSFAKFDKDATHAEIVFSKLKELQFIGSYSKQVGGYFVLPVLFQQKNVKKSEVESVLATLMTQAHSHYATALDKVNKVDFNSLVSDELAAGHANIDIKIGEKVYAVDVVLQKPLIWDKTWSATVTDCPIQEMSFEQKSEGVAGQIRLENGSTVQTARVDRASSNQIVVTIDTDRYVFTLRSATQMQLVKMGKSPLTDVTDKNYLFNHKN